MVIVTVVASIVAIVVAPIKALVAASAVVVVVVIAVIVATVATSAAALIVAAATMIATSAAISIVAIVATPVVVLAAAVATSSTATMILSWAIVILATAAGALVLSALPLIMVRVVRWRRGLVLPSVLLHLALLVVLEIVENRRLVLEAVDDLQHLDALGVGDLLRVARVGHRFVLVVFQPNVAQVRVRYVLHVDPAHLERALPLVLRPDARVGVVVDGGHHLRDATEVARSVDGEKQIHHATLLFALAERLIQALVAVLGRTPDFVLNTAMNIVFRVRLDDKESG